MIVGRLCEAGEGPVHRARGELVLMLATLRLVLAVVVHCAGTQRLSGVCELSGCEVNALDSKSTRRR